MAGSILQNAHSRIPILLQLRLKRRRQRWCRISVGEARRGRVDVSGPLGVPRHLHVALFGFPGRLPDRGAVSLVRRHRHGGVFLPRCGRGALCPDGPRAFEHVVHRHGGEGHGAQLGGHVGGGSPVCLGVLALEGSPVEWRVDWCCRRPCRLFGLGLRRVLGQRPVHIGPDRVAHTIRQPQPRPVQRVPSPPLRSEIQPSIPLPRLPRPSRGTYAPARLQCGRGRQLREKIPLLLAEVVVCAGAPVRGTPVLRFGQRDGDRRAAAVGAVVDRVRARAVRGRRWIQTQMRALIGISGGRVIDQVAEVVGAGADEDGVGLGGVARLCRAADAVDGAGAFVLAGVAPHGGVFFGRGIGQRFRGERLVEEELGAGGGEGALWG